MYSVKEVYYTIQGEGHHTGRPAVFLRFTGCNLWSGLEKDRKKVPSKELEAELSVLSKCRKQLEQGSPLRALELEPAEMKLLRGFQFLSAKPMLLILNVDESDASRSTKETLARLQLQDFAAEPAVLAVSVCAKIELEISELDAEDGELFLQEIGLNGPGLDLSLIHI